MGWLENAEIVEKVFGSYVDWVEEIYICPECDEPVSADDWDEDELSRHLCPICEFRE